MKKFLTDKEIMKWNDIVKNYIIKSYDGRYSSVPDILIFKDVSDPWGGQSMEQVPEPNIKYNLTFSVSSNRTESFFDILEKTLSAEFLTNLSITNNDNSSDKMTNETRKLIKPDVGVLVSKKSEQHEVINRTFTRYTYKFSGELTSIMAYVSCITDTINYFQMIWGYDDNKEHCLLQYPIGSIVSKIKDKSKDYLILEYDFSKNTNDIFEIKYYVSEMLNTNSSIIQYGESILCDEDELCHSRNNRIDDILN
jgi:hypothetical protein